MKGSDFILIYGLIVGALLCVMWYHIGKEDGHKEYHQGKVKCETLKDKSIHCYPTNG